MKKVLALFVLTMILGGTAVYAETASSTVCAQVITWAKNSEGKIERFPTACVPSGWTVISFSTKIEDKIQKIEESAKKKIEKIESDMIRRADSQPIILEVGPKGKALIRGKIESISSSTASTTGSLVVKSWGGSWTINVYSDTEIAGNNRTLVGYKVGDYVGARGQIDPNKPLTIDATVVRNWTNNGEVRIQKVEDNKDRKIEKLEDKKNATSTPPVTISADRARELALIAFPGKTITKVELKTEEGKIVWSVRFSDDKKIYIDAKTGATVKSE